MSVDRNDNLIAQPFNFRESIIGFCFSLLWFLFLSPRPSNCQEWYRYPAGALTGVRSGAETGLLSLRLSASQGAPFRDFLLVPACPIEKVTQWEGFLYLTSGSETDEGVEQNKDFA